MMHLCIILYITGRPRHTEWSK